MLVCACNLAVMLALISHTSLHFFVLSFVFPYACAYVESKNQALEFEQEYSLMQKISWKFYWKKNAQTKYSIRMRASLI